MHTTGTICIERNAGVELESSLALSVWNTEGKGESSFPAVFHFENDKRPAIHELIPPAVYRFDNAAGGLLDHRYFIDQLSKFRQ